MIMRKKIISMLLIMSILTTFLPLHFIKAEAATEKSAVIGEAKYASETDLKKDYKVTYYYTDEYFGKSGYKDDPSLATMSMIVAMAAGRSNTEEYANKSKNIKNLWTDCGFTKISINDDFKKEPTATSTAFGCASKKITADGKDYTLISVAVSGTRSTHEWGGAFYFGESGPYLAGRYVADRIIAYLKNYIKNNKIKGNVKIWLSGFGVAGSAVNLVGADLDNGINLGNGVNCAKENVYAYCFECTTTDLNSNNLTASKYKNIFVYNNPYDFITHFAPDRYSMGYYGVVKKFPTAHGDSQYVNKRDKMLTYLKKIDGAPAYILDDFEEKKVSLFGEGHVEPDYSKVYDMNEYLKYGVDALAETCAPNRQQYVAEFQDDLCELFDFVLGSNDLNWYDAVEYFGKIVSDNILPVGINMLLGYEDNLKGMFAEYAYTAMDKAGVQAEAGKVTTFSKALAKVACRFGAKYPDYCITLFANFKVLFGARETTYTLAWLESVDPNYQAKGKNIGFCQAKPEKSSYTYTGKAVKPAIIVTNGKTTLKSGKDYTVSYSKNTAVGTATATINGKGSYVGKLTTTFSIIPGTASLKTSCVSNGIKLKWSQVKGAGGYYIYRKTGSSSSWKEVAKISSGSTKEWTDKNVSHNKNYIYSIIAYKDKLKGARSSSITSCYLSQIKLESVTSPGTGKLQIKWSSLPSVSGYQVYYSQDKDFNFITKSYDTEKMALAVGGMESGVRYYAKVRAFIKKDGKTYYGAWSSVKGVKVR